MKSEEKWMVAIVLSVAFILFMLMLTSFVLLVWQSSKFIYYSLPIIILALNILALILNLKFSKNSFAIFAITLISCCVVFLYLLRLDIIGGSIKNWWPMIGIFSGIALIIAGFYKNRRVRFEFLIPSIAMLLTGGWFLLFSWKIISIPFIQVVIICGPLLLIMSIVLLFVMLYYQKKNKLFIINDDEYDQFEKDDYIKNHAD